MGTRGPLFHDLETNEDHQANHKEIFNKRTWTDSIQEKIKRQRESKLKMVRCEPQRRRTLYLTATAWELIVLSKKKENDFTGDPGIKWL